MRVFLTGIVALLLMSSQGLLAQPALFSTESKGTVAAQASTGRAGQRARRVEANASALAEAQAVEFNLFEDRRFLVNRTRRVNAGRSTIWSGEIDGTTGSEVIMVIDGGLLTGSIRTADGEFFRVRPDSDGTHLIEQVDASQTVTDDIELAPPAELLMEDSKDDRRAEASTAGAAEATANSLVDLLVVYTPEARQQAGSTAKIESRIQLAIAETNQAFTNSGIAMQFRLVHAAEAAPSSGQAASSTYLSQVTTNAAIRNLRNQYGADMVSAWVYGPGAGGGVVGIGWIMTNPSSSFQSAAYSIVEMNFANAPYYSFSHELGHNLGGAHDRANSSTGGAYSYSYGMQSQPGRFVSVMAYTGGCSGCSRIPYFSNPDVNYGGYPTGIVSTASNSADMRLTFNATRAFAEQFRATVVPVSATTTPTTQPAEPSTPAQPTPPPAYAPTVSSLAPSAGTGNSTTYAATFADGNGATDIRTVLLTVQSGSSANGCLVSIDRASGAMLLRNDADNGWISGINLGGSGSLSNTQCTITGSGASLTPSGNNLNLALPVSFKSSFAGTRDVYLKAEDIGGLNSGWQKLGTWTIPSAVVPPSPPSFSSLTPSSGAGKGATFTAVFTDPNSANEISRVILLMNNSLSTRGGCYFYLYPQNGFFYLLNSAGTGWLGPVAFGSGSVSNGLCTVSPGSSATVNGTQLNATLPVQFGSGFTGTRYIYANVADQNGAFQAWTTAGTYNVQ